MPPDRLSSTSTTAERTPLMRQLDAFYRRDKALRLIVSEARYEIDNHGRSALQQLRAAVAELDAAQTECDEEGVRGRPYAD